MLLMLCGVFLFLALVKIAAVWPPMGGLWLRSVLRQGRRMRPRPP